MFPKRSLIAALVAFALPLATAATPVPQAEKHCVATLSPIQPGEKSSRVSNEQCFGTFKEAISFATGGQVQLYSGQAHRVDPEAFSTLRLSTVIGIDYQDSNFSGNTWTWTSDNPNGCLDGTGYGVDTMPSNWDNKVSSAAAYQGCNNWLHYQDQYHGGSQHPCTCASMGIMNDRTSSETWSQ